MSEPDYTLVIGTKNWSSWSLRPWLLMQVAGLAFNEIEIALRSPDTAAAIAMHSPSGMVPVLKTKDGLTIWDSLAIAEFLADRHPELGLWPQAFEARACARAVSAEMHSGFRNLRMEMPMDCLARRTDVTPSLDVRREITRITTLWHEARAAYAAGGPFLFGRFSIADAMYAPVVSRFRTYGVPLGSVEQRYADAIWTLPAMARWLDGCAAEATPARPPV